MSVLLLVLTHCTCGKLFVQPCKFQAVLRMLKVHSVKAEVATIMTLLKRALSQVVTH